MPNEWKDAQAGRIRDAARSALLPKDGKTVRTATRELQEVRELQSTPYFDAVRNYRLPVGQVLDGIESRPSIERALKIAERKVADRGNFTRDGDNISGDVIKRAVEHLADRSGAAYRAGRNADGGDYQAARAALLERADALMPEYAQGRAIFAGTKRLDEAMADGQRLFRRNVSADDIADEFARMNDSEKEFYRLGVADALEGLVANTQDASNKARFINSEAVRSKIVAAFGDDPEAGRELVRLVESLQEGFSRRAEILASKGSQTQPRQQAAREFDEDIQGPAEGVFREAADTVSAPLEVPRKAANAVFGRRADARRQRISKVLADILFEGQGLKYDGTLPDVRVPNPGGPAAAIAASNSGLATE